MQTTSAPLGQIPIAPLPVPPNTNPIVASSSHPPKKSKAVPILIGTLLLFTMILTGAGASYFFYILPRLNTIRLVDDLKPQVAQLKISAKNVRSVMDKMHIMITEEIKLDTPAPLETSGLIIHPNLASIQVNSPILGTSIRKDVAIVEETVLAFANEMQDTTSQLINTNPNVAGISTAKEGVYVEKLRALKDEVIRSDEYVSKAKSDLVLVTSKSTSNSDSIVVTAKQKLRESSKIEQKANPYFAEAQKITDYYKILSDVLITMNTKIQSVRNSFALSGATIKMDKSDTIDSGISKLSQAQVFLDQAKKDIEDIKKLSETLKNIPKDTLPMESAAYHEHNIKVLATVTEYFTSLTTVVQGTITTTNVMMGKIKDHLATGGDLRTYEVLMTDIAPIGQKADAKFLSDIQSLAGEEATLTKSFWQNNTLIATGSLVEIEIDNFDKSLSTLHADNQVPFFNK